MAENKIDVDILINTAQSAKTLGELKKAMKDLKGSINDVSDTDFNRLSQSLNDVEGKLGDMNDMAKNVSGSGIERLNASIGSLQEGLMSADPGKLSAGMKGLGAAMNAIPIFLLIEGLKYLYDNFDQVAEIVKQITGSFSEEEMAVKRTTKALELQTEATSALVKQYDREIELLEASGASDQKIIEIKKKKIATQLLEAEATIKAQDAKIMEIKSNDDLSESLGRVSAWIQRKLGNDKAAEIYEQSIAFEKLERIKEEEKKRTEATETIKDLQNSLLVLDAEANVKATENNKKSLEQKEKDDEEAAAKRKKLKDEEAAADKRRIADYNKFYKDQYDQQVQDAKDEEEIAKEEADVKARDKQAKLKLDLLENNISRKEALEQQKQIDLENTNLTEQEKLLIKAEYAEKEKQLEKEKRDAIFDMTTKGLSGIQAISDIAFTISMANKKKESKEAEATARKQFNVNKAFQISSTTIQGIQNGITAYGAGLKAASATGIGAAAAPAVGAAYAAISGLGSLASIAKIASTQFGGSGGAANIPNGGGSGAGGGQATPQFQAPTFFGLGQVTGPNDQRTAGPQRVYVTEGDISKVQNRVSVIESRARIS